MRSHTHIDGITLSPSAMEDSLKVRFLSIFAMLTFDWDPKSLKIYFRRNEGKFVVFIEMILTSLESSLFSFMKKTLLTNMRKRLNRSLTYLTLTPRHLSMTMVVILMEMKMKIIKIAQ